MITLCFVFLAGSLLWLSRTVDQSLDDRTNAAEIAFQAARAGAQAIDPVAARSALIWMSAMGVVFFFFSEPFLRVFTDDPRLLTLGAEAMKPAAHVRYARRNPDARC